MATIAQTITVIKDRKVVSTSKHLINIFNDAKTAYTDKKAEFKAAREDEQERKRAQRSDDSIAKAGKSSGHASRESSKNRSKTSPARTQNPKFQRGYSDSFHVDREGQVQIPYNQLHGNEDGSGLERRRSTETMSMQRTSPGPQSPERMDLASDETPPPLPPRPVREDDELTIKMSALQRMLEEANCMQYSARATMKALEKNPDQMAACALALAEISNLLRKMAPGALMSLKGLFPAVVALLLSPEFLIAAGVGVGITIVAFGGYKIIKRIKAKKDSDAEDQADDLEEVELDLEKVQGWQRGVPDAEADGVEAEFATPMASQQLRQEAIMPANISAPKDESRGARSSNSAKAEVEQREKVPVGLRMLFKKGK